MDRLQSLLTASLRHLVRQLDGFLALGSKILGHHRVSTPRLRVLIFIAQSPKPCKYSHNYVVIRLRLGYHIGHMNQSKRHRLTKATFAILLALIIWGIVSLAFNPITVTTYWGVGLGVVAMIIFMLSLGMENIGLPKTLIMVFSIFIIVLGAQLLNLYRGWPFGLVSYHDVLGWKILRGIAWPIPLFWTFMVSSALMLTWPKQPKNDPKVLFSWAFDAAMVTVLADLIVEPILTATSAQAWSTNGIFLGIPLSNFVGWFLTAFVAGFAAILLAKLWQTKILKPPALLLIMLGLSLLGLITSSRLSLTVVQILCALAAIFFAIWSFRLRKEKKNNPPAKIEDGNTTVQA